MDSSAEPIAADADAHARGGRIIDHYRLDASRRLLKALGIGASFMAVGCVVVALALVVPVLEPDVDLGITRLPVGAVDVNGNRLVDETPVHELGFGLFGLFCIVGGSVSTVISLNRMLREESYLALRTDGAFFRDGDACELLPWDTVSTVVYDEAGRSVRFERHDGSVWMRAERFAGIDHPSLAKRASEIRRKSLFGLI